MTKEKDITDEEWHDLAIKSKEQCQFNYCDDYCKLFDFDICPSVSFQEIEEEGD